MPKREDVKKVLLIGSGPIVIGQAAEFDYAGTQACLALKEEGCEVVLANSNPATIMTDRMIADKVYMEPLTFDYLAAILYRERPDALLPGIGGQTGLNLAIELARAGVLRECGTKLLGTSSESIELAEDRERFKALCEAIGEPVIPSEIAYDLPQAEAAAAQLGCPVVLRPAFTLGGTGSGSAANDAELRALAAKALRLSPVGKVLIEKSVRGYKEIEFEVMRDADDTVVTVCGMENVDPVGVHTGDSVVVAPILSLSKAEENMLIASAHRIIRALKIEGGCNIQFALHPTTGEYYVIEVNPRVSRSSALASKASGYPIARVSAKVALGLRLAEIPLAGTTAATEPRLDYIVAKFPRFPFDKFPALSNKLGTQMKATGEVMAIGSTLEESLLKAVRSLETGCCHLRSAKFDAMPDAEIYAYLSDFRDDTLFAVAELLHRGATIDSLCARTGIAPRFVAALQSIVATEQRLQANPQDAETLREAKRLGFSDAFIAQLWGIGEAEVYALRKAHGVLPVFRRVDTLRGEAIPYYYSSYTGGNDARRSERQKLLVLGAGPIRIGQGIEFDYSSVHAVQTIRRAGFEAVLLNNNPETVSTDYTTADKLYFEPLTVEDVLAVVDFEKPLGVIATLGGQTALNLARPLAARGVKLIGTDSAAIARAEDRDAFEKLLLALRIPQPPGAAVTSVEDGVQAAAALGYPLLVRPSFVLGGRAMEIVANEAMLRRYLQNAVALCKGEPVLVDKYIPGTELEVDALCDGREVFVPGIIELVERSGVHSGDSISLFPAQRISDAVRQQVLDCTQKLGLALGVVGLYNLQFVADRADRVYVIEANPRSSRTVPFLSKATGLPLADLATEVMLGKSLRELGVFDRAQAENTRVCVKVPVFSSSKLAGPDPCLSPEMKSTGEAFGAADTLPHALYKALLAGGLPMTRKGVMLADLAPEDRDEALPLLRRFAALGFSLAATPDTAAFLREQGFAVPVMRGDALFDAVRAHAFSGVLSTRSIRSAEHAEIGAALRSAASENGAAVFSSLDTARVLLDALEDPPSLTAAPL